MLGSVDKVWAVSVDWRARLGTRKLIEDLRMSKLTSAQFEL